MATIVSMFLVSYEMKPNKSLKFNCILCGVRNKISPTTGPRCPEGSRKLRFPDYVKMTQDGGKVVSLTHLPLFIPRKYSWYSFLLEAESTPGPHCDRNDYVNEKFQ